MSDQRLLLHELNRVQRGLDGVRADQLSGIYRQAFQLLTTASTIKAWPSRRGILKRTAPLCQ